MTDASTENLERIKAKIAWLRRSRSFVRWDESAGLARELLDLMGDIEATVTDPRAGVEILAAFFQTDKATFERCDDSSGHVGGVYAYEAKDLFVQYASRCDDKDWLSKLVLKVNRKDDYGARDILVRCASEYLPEENLRALVAEFQKLAAKQSDKYDVTHQLLNVEALARQLKDAALYERTRAASFGTDSTGSRLDIARVHLECGDPETALAWLMRIPDGETFKAEERDGLLVQIYGRLNDAEKQVEAAWRLFRRERTADALRDLLAVIGDHKRDEVIAGEAALIGGEAKLSYSDAAFLVDTGCIKEAADYLVERADQLDGDYYEALLPLVDAMEASGKSLAATVLYRALLDSILGHARNKAYGHGARYLKKLDWLARMIDDWRGIEDHQVYSARLHEKHGRKTSFWSRY